MTMKTTFALYFGNRGFFPGELIADARRELTDALQRNGYGFVMMEENLTRYGAVETIEEGKLYRDFLEKNRGKYDGIILCLPNFGDENGASVAFSDVDVPILVQAYPDEAGKMDFSHRRDAMCGKLAMCNVLRQLKIRFTQTRDFVTSPLSASFAEDLRRFAGICRTVKGMKHCNIGAIGARTTAFKTVRFDEIAMQNKGINVETVDLSYLFALMDGADAKKIAEKKEKYGELACFGCYPDCKLDAIARLGVAVDVLIKQYDLQAVAIRCWDELEKRYGVAPCLVLGELNERGIAAACELDVNNAVMMRAMSLAADCPCMLLDVNNNYGDDPDKCILFHCGPVPASLLCGKGTIEEHLMFKKSYGEGSGVGINKAEIITGDVTVGSFRTEDGNLYGFLRDGVLTGDPVEKEFFGCSAVFSSQGVNEMLVNMANNGYRHHVAVTRGQWADSVKEAFEKYLGYKTDKI